MFIDVRAENNNAINSQFSAASNVANKNLIYSFCEIIALRYQAFPQDLVKS